MPQSLRRIECLLVTLVVVSVGCGKNDAAIPAKSVTAASDGDKQERPAATRTLATSRISPMQQEPKPENAKRIQPPKKYKLTAVVDHVHFDRRCGLLSFLVLFYVVGEEPQSVYLVSNNLAFPHFGLVGVYHVLQVTQDAGTWVFDLSWPVPLAKNRGPDDAGIEGRLFPVMETGLRESLIYSFQFPLLLDPGYADVKLSTAPDAVHAYELIRAPRGKVQMRLKLGYGYEPVSEFVRREQGPNGWRPEMLQRILDEWQTIVLTEPVTVDFSQDPVTVEFPETAQE